MGILLNNKHDCSIAVDVLFCLDRFAQCSLAVSLTLQAFVFGQLRPPGRNFTGVHFSRDCFCMLLALVPQSSPIEKGLAWTVLEPIEAARYLG